jgi:hypothetical protein
VGTRTLACPGKAHVSIDHVTSLYFMTSRFLSWKGQTVIEEHGSSVSIERFIFLTIAEDHGLHWMALTSQGGPVSQFEVAYST